MRLLILLFALVIGLSIGEQSARTAQRPDPGDSMHWPNDAWFRQRARSISTGHATIHVEDDAVVDPNVGGVLGAYVSASVWHQRNPRDRGPKRVYVAKQVFVPLPKDRVWQSSSPDSF